MTRWQRLGLFGGLVLVLAVVNASIAGKERLRASGDVVLLELAPRDPRSLMQGDYMVLTYAIERALEDALPPEAPARGTAVVKLDEHRVATFARIDGQGRPLGPGEHRLRYRRHKGRVRVGPDAFFFQEGQGENYAGARYGELRVAEDGTALLVGLRDRARERLD